MERLLNEKEVASLLSVSLAAVRRWRYEGRGPKFLKLETVVRYDPATVRDWIASCTSEERFH